MCAAAFDFVAERGFIAASDDPNQLFDWMSDYDQRRRDAQADDDDEVAAQFQELRQEAEDRVVELKAARLRRAAPRPAELKPAVQPAAGPPTRREVERPAHTSVHEAPKPTVDPLAVARAERARRRAAEEAAARKAAEEAEAAAERAADEELRQLQERAANAKARRDAALAATARIEAEAKRAAAEAVREQARRQAVEEVEDAERKATEAEAAAHNAATSAAMRPATRSANPTVGRMMPPTLKADEPTPLALLFQERLTEVMGTPASTAPARRPSIAPPAARVAAPAASPVPSQPVAAPPIPAKVPAPPPNPVDDLPALTGTDLAAYRTWLGASQRALAAKLAVEQSVISKSEGKPTTVLPPQLRKALHLAMQEPRDAAKGAS